MTIPRSLFGGVVVRSSETLDGDGMKVFLSESVSHRLSVFIDACQSFGPCASSFKSHLSASTRTPEVPSYSQQCSHGIEKMDTVLVIKAESESRWTTTSHGKSVCVVDGQYCVLPWKRRRSKRAVNDSGICNPKASRCSQKPQSELHTLAGPQIRAFTKSAHHDGFAESNLLTSGTTCHFIE